MSLGSCEGSMGTLKIYVYIYTCIYIYIYWGHLLRAGGILLEYRWKLRASQRTKAC